MSCKYGENPTPLATAAVLELLTGQGADKHGDSWMTREDREDMNHHDIHKMKYFSGDYPDYDCDTNGLHLISALARMQLVLERRLRRDLAKSAELDSKTEVDSPVPTSAENEMGGCG